MLFLCYFVAYLDRVNVSFAKLQMLDDLKLSDTVYGLGSGIFFIGYFGIDMSGWRPRIKGYFAALRLIVAKI